MGRNWMHPPGRAIRTLSLRLVLLERRMPEGEEAQVA